MLIYISFELVCRSLNIILQFCIINSIMLSAKRKAPTLTLECKRARSKVVNDLAIIIVSGKKKSLKESTLVYPWLTRHMLNGCVRRLKAKEGETIAPLPSSDIANTCTTIVLNDDVQKGGRPKGTTKVSKLNIDEKKVIAYNEIAKLYSAKRDENGGFLNRGQFKMITNTVLKRLKLDPEQVRISAECIRSRVKRKSLVVDNSKNQNSPMLPIEQIILQICQWKQDAGQPITPTEGLELANSLIKWETDSEEV